jgi:hypothetical protein
MGVVLGKNIFIYAGASGTTPIIAAAKSCSISRKADLIERASASQQSAKEFLAGRTEWDVAISHLVTTETVGNTSAPFSIKIQEGGEYTLSVVVGSVRLTGKAICVQADLSGAVGSLASGSVKFKGSGPLQ